MIVDDADRPASFATHAPDSVRGMTNGANSLNVFFARVTARRIGAAPAFVFRKWIIADYM
jgi:hypothetical protein